MTYLEAMEKGGEHLLRRAAWPGDKVVFRALVADLPLPYVNNMSMFPDVAKAELMARGGDVRFRNITYAMYGSMVTTYGYSQEDLAADDWEVYNRK